MDQVEIRALRNVGAGHGRDLKKHEVATVDAHAAAILVSIDAAELTNPDDAPKLQRALRMEREKQAVQEQQYRAGVR